MPPSLHPWYRFLGGSRPTGLSYRNSKESGLGGYLPEPCPSWLEGCPESQSRRRRDTISEKAVAFDVSSYPCESQEAGVLHPYHAGGVLDAPVGPGVG